MLVHFKNGGQKPEVDCDDIQWWISEFVKVLGSLFHSLSNATNRVKIDPQMLTLLYCIEPNNYIAAFWCCIGLHPRHVISVKLHLRHKRADRRTDEDNASLHPSVRLFIRSFVSLSVVRSLRGVHLTRGNEPRYAS